MRAVVPQQHVVLAAADSSVRDLHHKDRPGKRLGTFTPREAVTSISRGPVNQPKKRRDWISRVCSTAA